MDLAATSKQWFDKMPEATKPLPMLEMAFVASVSDAEKLRQGATTYIDVVKEAYKLVQEAHPNDVPEFEWPKAKVSERSGGGKLFTYALPEEWGVDSQIAVNAGLTDSTAVVSTMPQTTEKLLADTAANFDTSLPLDHPAAMVTHIEFAKGIAATRPWINYGLDVATGKIKPPKKKSEESEDAEDSDDADEDRPPEPPSAMLIQLGLIVPQFEQLLDVAMAVRSASSISYEEDGVWVTHSETHIEDLKDEKAAQ